MTATICWIAILHVGPLSSFYVYSLVLLTYHNSVSYVVSYLMLTLLAYYILLISLY